MTQGFEMKNTHDLKTDTKVFQDVLDGNKTFEIRFNDRDFQVGDSVLLKETQFTGEQIESGQPLIFTGREIHKRISYLLSGYGLQVGWVILGIADEAGQQSRQAEIDALKSEAINVNNEFYADGQKSMRKIMQGRIDELQKRIDELQTKLDSLQHTSSKVLSAISLSCASYLCEIKKLRKAINDIKNHLEGLSEKHVSTHAYLGVLDILDILKGNKDEK